MGKKKTRSTYTSKGLGRSIAKDTVRLVRQGRTELEKVMHKVKAWQAGKNPWITVPGTEAKARFVRVRANNVWGDPRRTANIYKTRDDE